MTTQHERRSGEEETPGRKWGGRCCAVIAGALGIAVAASARGFEDDLHIARQLQTLRDTVARRVVHDPGDFLVANRTRWLCAAVDEAIHGTTPAAPETPGIAPSPQNPAEDLPLRGLLRPGAVSDAEALPDSERMLAEAWGGFSLASIARPDPPAILLTAPNALTIESGDRTEDFGRLAESPEVPGFDGLP